MPKPSLVSIAASLNGLNELVSNPGVTETAMAYTALDLRRIADALERIASSLEKLTDGKAEPTAPVPITTLQPKPKPVQIPVPAAKPAPQAQAKPTPKVAPIVKPVSTTQTKPKGVLNPSPNNLKPSTNEPATKKNSVLEKYLAERHITVPKQKVKAIPANQAARENLALHLGQNFAICQELYKELLENVGEPDKTFEYSLIGATGKQNTKLQKFCSLLKKADLLEYTYKGIPDYSFRLRVKAKNKDKNYLEGIWLERYMIQEVSKIVQEYATTPKQHYDILPNLKIKFQDGSETELDLFFALGQKVFCIETKMRPGIAELTSALKKIRPLGLEDKDILIAVADKTEEECEKLKQALGEVRITRLVNLEQTVISMLREA